MAADWSLSANTAPVASLLILLFVSISLPFFTLSATAPLLQKWFAQTSHVDAANPYFLYAASNTGSIVALFAYPTLIELFLGLIEQSKAWTLSYTVLLVLMIWCAFLLWRNFSPSSTDDHAEVNAGLTEDISWRLRFHWVVLAMVPSSLMLGVTTYITTDIASVPLLWVIPLSLSLDICHRLFKNARDTT